MTGTLANKLEKLYSFYYNRGLFNGNALIAINGETIYEGVFGWADRPSGRLLTQDSIFNVASVAKTFTSAAVLLLKERGLLELDQPIERWFPQLPYKGVTIRQLLGHTSGIPNYIRPVRTGLFGDRWSLERLADNGDLIEQICILQPEPEFAPNDCNEYSNTGYMLLAMLIEQVSGRSFHQFLDEEIFKPYGLTRTLEDNRAERARYIDDYAVGYYIHPNGDAERPYKLPGMEFCYYLDEIQGDGNVHSTIGDLLKWDRLLRTERLLGRETLEEAYSPVRLNDGSLGPNGLGWFAESIPERGMRIQHAGYWPGYSAVFHRYLEPDIVIIMLSNEEYEDSYLERNKLAAEVESLLFA